MQIPGKGVSIRYPHLEKKLDPDRKRGYEELKEKWLSDEASIPRFQARLITPWEPWDSEKLSRDAETSADKLRELYSNRNSKGAKGHQKGTDSGRSHSHQKANSGSGKAEGKAEPFNEPRIVGNLQNVIQPDKQLKGTVKWFNDKKRFGFIEKDEGGDIFVHHNAIQMDGSRTLKEGDRVTYDVSQGRKGPEAKNVRMIK